MDKEKTYIIVHPDEVFDSLTRRDGGRDSSKVLRVCNEIIRIQTMEDHRVITDLSSIPGAHELGRDREIFVCGAYIHTCIGIVMDALKMQGYDPKIYEAGSL